MMAVWDPHATPEERARAAEPDDWRMPFPAAVLLLTALAAGGWCLGVWAAIMLWDVLP